MSSIRSEPIQPNDNNIMPAISVDCVIFGLDKKQLNVLLVKHAQGNSKGKWGLPGGWVNKDESLESAATRVLYELTGLNDLFLEQLKAFSEVARTGKQRVITVPFYSLIPPKLCTLTSSKVALEVKWACVRSQPALIFDHEAIINAGLEHLRRVIRYTPIGVNLLPEKFTLGQLQELYEIILNKKLDKPNFRRKMLRTNVLVRCNETQNKVPHRAGALYFFDIAAYNDLCKQGFNIEF